MLNLNQIGIVQEHYDHMYEMVLTKEFPLVEFLSQIHNLNHGLETAKYYGLLMKEGFISKQEGQRIINKKLNFDDFYYVEKVA